MFDDFMDHTCNIYHLSEEPVEAGYGIAASGVKKEHMEPDEVDVKCHFHVNSATGSLLRVVQKEPYSSVDGALKLSVPIGTDIRMNDIVEDCRNGLKYRVGVPKVIHGGHHIIAIITRREGVEAAI